VTLVVEVGFAVEDDRLALEVGQQTFGTAFAADARLLEAAEGNAKVGPERVVAHRARPELPGDRVGASDPRRGGSSLTPVVLFRDAVGVYLTSDIAKIEQPLASHRRPAVTARCILQGKVGPGRLLSPLETKPSPHAVSSNCRIGACFGTRLGSCRRQTR
jgi:hypothetical protein